MAVGSPIPKTEDSSRLCCKTFMIPKSSWRVIDSAIVGLIMHPKMES